MRVLLALLLAAPAGAQEGARLAADAAFGALGGFRVRPFQQAPRPAPAAPRPPQVCSALDLSGVTWPPSLSGEDKKAFTLALNITGSFEGRGGWSNITDDFDGQGVSLGLLQQNLGQGSLQPLLVKMRDDHPAALAAAFSPARLASLLAMVNAWSPPPPPPVEPDKPDSRIDEPEGGIVAQLAPQNAAGVRWAKRNLYDAQGAFDPAWKAELKALAATPEFVSLQIAAALRLHEQALRDEARVGVRELRAYLFAFDVAVQNGGFHAADFRDLASWKRKNPKASSTQKLLKLLQYRLRHVRRRFLIDVDSRKKAVIYGAGRVHGERRDLPAQYCYDGFWNYK